MLDICYIRQWTDRAKTTKTSIFGLHLQFCWRLEHSVRRIARCIGWLTMNNIGRFFFTSLHILQFISTHLRLLSRHTPTIISAMKNRFSISFRCRTTFSPALFMRQTCPRYHFDACFHKNCHFVIALNFHKQSLIVRSFSMEVLLKLIKWTIIFLDLTHGKAVLV